MRKRISRRLLSRAAQLAAGFGLTLVLGHGAAQADTTITIECRAAIGESGTKAFQNTASTAKAGKIVPETPPIRSRTLTKAFICRKNMMRAACRGAIGDCKYYAQRNGVEGACSVRSVTGYSSATTGRYACGK